MEEIYPDSLIIDIPALNSRARAAIRRALSQLPHDQISLRHVAELSVDELRSQHNCGQFTVECIQRVLIKAGLRLRRGIEQPARGEDLIGDIRQAIRRAANLFGVMEHPATSLVRSTLKEFVLEAESADGPENLDAETLTAIYHSACAALEREPKWRNERHGRMHRQDEE